MTTRRSILGAVAPLLAASIAVGSGPRRATAKGPSKKPKYYFKIIEVNVGKNGDSSTASMARELLEKELGSRPEFTADVGETSDEAALNAALKKRQLRGFAVSLRLDGIKDELKPPRPGGRLKQLSVDVRLSVFGTTFPDEKLAFGGDGEGVVEAEIVESRREAEAPPLIRDAMVQALKQAVDQAVTKLSLPRAAPLNESKRKRR